MAAETDRDEGTIPAPEDEYDSLWVLIGVPRGYRKDRDSDLFPVTHEQYVANRKADVRGTANPSIMNNPFWISQVGPRGLDAWSARTVLGEVEDPFEDSKDPVWCFNRFGATETKLPDGRLVCIGGEHDDVNEPDFCIYNDVVVYDAPQKTDPPPSLTPECINIYGYPVDVFPPTDFHTSTYYADPITDREMIFIIGGFGYKLRNRTDIYKLDLTNFSIQRVETSGTGPVGGIHDHKAKLLIEDGQPVIRITTRTEEIKPAAGMVAGEESTASAKNEGTLVADDNEESGMTIQGGLKLAVIEPSKVFTLRINDMRWI